MELLRINEKKLKVILSEEDMDRYRLDRDTMDYDTTETRSAFWQILDEAKHRTGFDACGARIFVQIYPSRGGGCELYVTKILAPAPADTKKAPPPPAREERTRPVVYLLPSLADLLRICRHLAATDYRGESAAYIGEGDACYLVLSEPLRGVGYPHSAPLYHPAEEYGERCSGNTKLTYVREHAHCLLDTDAVARLSALA